MIILVDANNLSGRLGILQEKDFDKKLIGIIKEYLKIKNIKIVLVFDSNDPIGDKKVYGNLTIIYSPRDGYYKSADDKIIEIIDGSDEKIRAVTDDIEIIKAAEKRNCEIEKTTEFAHRLDKVLGGKKDELDGEEKLSKDEVEKINNELLKEWN